MSMKKVYLMILSVVMIFGILGGERKVDASSKSATKMPSEISEKIDSSSIYTCEKAGGLYFYNRYKGFYFYDLKKETITDYTETIGASYNVSDMYQIGDYLYFSVSDYDYDYDYIYDEETGNYIYKNNSTYWTVIKGFNMVTGKIDQMFTIDDTQDRLMAVDDKLRFYLKRNEYNSETETSRESLVVYNKQGNLLSDNECPSDIYEIAGIDTTSGNIYYRGFYNWIYWGYDHEMSVLKAANIDKNDKIKFHGENMCILYQSYWYDHCKSIELIEGKYLVTLSTFNGGRVNILDSNVYDYTDTTEQTTSISLMGGGVETSVFNISNRDALLMAAKTKASEDFEDYGTRAAYNKSRESFIVLTGDKQLTEYYLNSGSEMGTYDLSYPQYAGMVMGDKYIAIEKSGEDYYIESISTKYPKDIKLSADQSLKPGESTDIVIKSESSINLGYTFESSDTSVLTVDEEGTVTAWSEGVAFITVKSRDGKISRTITITVTASKTLKVKSSISIKSKISTVNIHKTGNYTYGDIIDSYLVSLSKKKNMRVENTGKYLEIEYYKGGKVTKRKKIKHELDKFGGFYEGKTHFFIVYGQSNIKQDAKKEVLRVVKYTKSWKRVGALSISDINTVIPFDAGSLSMTETGGKLYIHTCHEMYKSEDGYNHQANMTFTISESDMKLVDCFTDVMNLSWGYVSHSFMQIIKTDDENIYRCDLGDAYPRGIALTITGVKDKLIDPKAYGVVQEPEDDSYSNYTGMSLGGMEITNKSIVIVNNAAVSSKSDVRNVFINVISKKDYKKKVIKLTNFKAGSKITALTPQLVKVNNNNLIVMWEEMNTKTNKYVTKLIKIDSMGNSAMDVMTTKLNLSDCQPIMAKDKSIKWYTSDKKKIKLYSVDPNNLNAVAKDTNKLGKKYRDFAKTGKYKIKKDASGKRYATFCGPSDKSLEIQSVPSIVSINGISYKVKGIEANAFKTCKKLKSLEIKSRYLKKSYISKIAFKGINKKVKVTIPKTKKKSYMKWIYKKGLKKNVKVKNNQG